MCASTCTCVFVYMCVFCHLRLLARLLCLCNVIGMCSYLCKFALWAALMCFITSVLHLCLIGFIIFALSCVSSCTLIHIYPLKNLYAAVFEH